VAKGLGGARARRRFWPSVEARRQARFPPARVMKSPAGKTGRSGSFLAIIRSYCQFATGRNPLASTAQNRLGPTRRAARFGRSDNCPRISTAGNTESRILMYVCQRANCDLCRVNVALAAESATRIPWSVERQGSNYWTVDAGPAVNSGSLPWLRPASSVRAGGRRQSKG